MILYHYSVDSYQGGDALLNDFKGQYRFAQPFLLALERDEDCFWSVFFSAMAVSRELRELGLRKRENYGKDATEGVFEFVRRREFAGRSASRVGCVYYCQTKEEAVAYLKADCLDSGEFRPDQVKLLEVAVEDSGVYRYDQAFFNRAEEALESGGDLSGPLALARAYFAGERSDDPLVEILSAGENRVLRELPLA